MSGSNGVQVDIEGYDEDAILTYDMTMMIVIVKMKKNKKVRLILTALFSF